MMTAMLTARNILAGRIIHDVWAVNEDAEYHEDGNRGARDDVATAAAGAPGGGAGGLRQVPRPIAAQPTPAARRRS